MRIFAMGRIRLTSVAGQTVRDAIHSSGSQPRPAYLEAIEF